MKLTILTSGGKKEVIYKKPFEPLTGLHIIPEESYITLEELNKLVEKGRGYKFIDWFILPMTTRF